MLFAATLKMEGGCYGGKSMLFMVTLKTHKQLNT